MSDHPRWIIRSVAGFRAFGIQMPWTRGTRQRLMIARRGKGVVTRLVIQC